MGSPKVWEQVITFEVLPFDGSCSDIHCPISCSLSIDGDGRNGSARSFKESHDGFVEEEPNDVIKNRRVNIRWAPRKKNDFVNYIDANDVIELLEMLNNNVSVDEITNIISDMYRNAALNTFICMKDSKSSGNSKPWYNTDCKRYKSQYVHAKNRYKGLEMMKMLIMLKKQTSYIKGV